MGLERITLLRKHRKMTLQELSEQSGVPVSTIKKISAGITTNPSLDTVLAIAGALGCGLDELVDTQSALDISDEGMEVARAYDSASEKDQNVVRLSLGLPARQRKKDANPEDRWRDYLGTPIAARSGGVRYVNTEEEARMMAKLAASLSEEQEN